MEFEQTPSDPSLLITETLGFSPQLFLDDIINIANNAVQDGVNGMEGLLENWADARAERMGGEWDSTQEAWSLRNVFTIPPDLPVVLPHHADLDLTHTPEEEQKLLDDIEQLRRDLDNQRQLKRLLTKGLAASERQRRRAERRREYLSFLGDLNLETHRDLPEKFFSMYQSLSSAPELDPATMATLVQLRMSEPGKRQWETNKTGYYNWALTQVVKNKNGQGVRKMRGWAKCRS
ncbi:hypothetical protein BD779DRAFT_1740220 [Infundibulicybe gibba]|nr:hypothetical protein BD779DRAFT_1740220 [Infundibulicybe gibba]